MYLELLFYQQQKIQSHFKLATNNAWEIKLVLMFYEFIHTHVEFIFFKSHNYKAFIT